ncbi:HNH endonuclease [Bradyrhizobium shewense]|nr:HNH endonuclease [Bradyrhizobium shewense]
MIIVKWLEGDSKGYDDHLPNDCIRVSAPLLEHAIVGPRGWIRIGRCSVSVNGKSVTFDYTGEHSAWNTEQEFYLGQMSFEFRDSSRAGIPEVLWKDRGDGEEFQSGYAVAEFRNDSNTRSISSDEGDGQLKTHLERERSTALRQEKLLDELERKGSIRCEVCLVDLVEQYGKHGLAGYEIHHRKPIANGSRETYLKDLAILCANCHRVLHRTKPLSSVKDFAKAIRLKGPN